jgi:hypothetical protein
MPFSRGISLIFPRLFRKPLPGFCFLSQLLGSHLPAKLDYPRTKCQSDSGTKYQSKWWCVSSLSHGNFNNHGVYLSSAISPLSRSAMSIVLQLPQLRIALVK